MSLARAICGRRSSRLARLSMRALRLEVRQSTTYLCDAFSEEARWPRRCHCPARVFLLEVEAFAAIRWAQDIVLVAIATPLHLLPPCATSTDGVDRRLPTPS